MESQTSNRSQIFNYLRVSSTDQITDRQLVDIPCDRLYEEKVSGKDTNRPQLQAMLSNLRKGDLVNVHEMSRLGRNTKDLLSLVDEILGKGASINFRKENLVFNSGEQAGPFQEFQLQMLAAVCQFERALTRQRQAEGIALAKKAGKYHGGQKKLSESHKEALLAAHAKGGKPAQLARDFDISRASVYNYLKELKTA
jgi:DNA invertase Pin-like site-specific DNA recombinase